MWNGYDWGPPREVTAQLAAVSQPIMAADAMTTSHHLVVFDEDGSFAYDKQTGEYLPFHKENGTYHTPMWVSVGGQAPGGDESGFGRPGRK